MVQFEPKTIITNIVVIVFVVYMSSYYKNIDIAVVVVIMVIMQRSGGIVMHICHVLLGRGGVVRKPEQELNRDSR